MCIWMTKWLVLPGDSYVDIKVQCSTRVAAHSGEGSPTPTSRIFPACRQPRPNDVPTQWPTTNALYLLTTWHQRPQKPRTARTQEDRMPWIRKTEDTSYLLHTNSQIRESIEAQVPNSPYEFNAMVASFMPSLYLPYRINKKLTWTWINTHYYAIKHYTLYSTLG